MGINYRRMNNRPSWEKAPKWAMYTAMDEDGEWFWYENKPECDTRLLLWTHLRGGKVESVAYMSNDLETDAHWTKTLEKRKEVETDEA